MPQKTKITGLWGDDVGVSSIIGYGALNNPDNRALYLNFPDDLDSATLTCYPLNTDFTVRLPTTVAADFGFIVSTITGKPILFQECGYPSGSVNNSSEMQQADFITTVFGA